jgi:COMPASS component BRE2
MYIALPPRRQANKKDLHDPAHIKRVRIAIDLKGQETFESLEYPQSKEMISLMDYSGKSSSSASVPPPSKKSVTVKTLPDRSPFKAARSDVTPHRPLPTCPGSRIAFFVNGECQGIAFQDLYDYLQLRATDSSRKGKDKKRTREGVEEHRENPFDDGTLGYYPFISLFNDACVRLNPGPNFDCPPPPDIDAILTGVEGSSDQTWRPMSERYAEYMTEQWALDAEEEEAARVESVRKAALEKAEAERKAQRNKKRQQMEARKRAKKTEGEPSTVALDDNRVGSTTSVLISGLGQPSPLRHGMAYNGDGFEARDHSPAPTITSSGDVHGLLSGYNSDNVERDGSGEGVNRVEDMVYNTGYNNERNSMNGQIPLV